MSTEALISRDCFSFNTRPNMLYRFCNRPDNLTLSMLRWSHFKLVAIKVGARDLLDCIVVPVIRNRYSYLLLLFTRQYSSSIIRCSIIRFIYIEF